MEGSRVLLLLDSHSSRLQPFLWKFVSTFNIDVITFPAHTSHLLQPLDKTVNGALKQSLRSIMATPESTEVKLVREALVSALPTSLSTALHPDVIISGFKKSGIHPFQPSAIVADLPEEPAVSPILWNYQKKKRGFEISGFVITDGKFLETWIGKGKEEGTEEEFYFGK